MPVFPYRYSKALPLSYGIFVGRNEEVKVLQGYLNFGTSSTKAIGISGPPGFGKSSLAIHVCHKHRNSTTQYFDLSVVSDTYQLIYRIVNITESSFNMEEVKVWASKLKNNTVLLFDNCDRLMSSPTQRMQFIDLVKNLIRYSSKVKVIFTTQHVTVFLQDEYELLELKELTEMNSIKLLKKLTTQEAFTHENAKKIVQLVGHVPLAIRVVGSLLKYDQHLDAKSIINQLNDHLLSTLSPPLIPSSDHILTALSFSYQQLPSLSKMCGRILSQFPGSFSKDAAIGVLTFAISSYGNYDEKKKATYPHDCVNELLYRSLLQYSPEIQRYSFHMLVKQMFLKMHQESDNNAWEREVFDKGFIKHYITVWNSIASVSTIDSALNQKYNILLTLDTERHNIKLLEDLFLQYGYQHSDGMDLLTLSDLASSSLESHLLVQSLHDPDLRKHISVKEDHAVRLKWLFHIDLLSDTILHHTEPENYIRIYINLVIHISHYEELMNGTSSSTRFVLSREARIKEIFYGPVQTNGSLHILRYYRSLYMQFLKQGDIDNAVQALIRGVSLTARSVIIDLYRTRRCSVMEKLIAKAKITARDLQTTRAVKKFNSLKVSQDPIAITASKILRYYAYRMSNQDARAEKIARSLPTGSSASHCLQSHTTQEEAAFNFPASFSEKYYMEVFMDYLWYAKVNRKACGYYFTIKVLKFFHKYCRYEFNPKSLKFCLSLNENFLFKPVYWYSGCECH